MNLEDFREILQNMTDVKITNTLLSKALDMKLPSITRKIKDKSDVKLVQIKRLEKFFDVDLSQYYDVYIYQNNGNNKPENYNFDEFYENGSLYERLENRQGTSLSGIWEEETRRYLAETGIPQDIMESLIRLGSELGTIDIEMQVRTLDLYLEQMEQKMEDMRTEQKERIRLYQCVGVTGGIFLAIILL